jgi:hypothetical protein
VCVFGSRYVYAAYMKLGDGTVTFLVCAIQTNWRSRNRRAAVLIISSSSSLPLGDPKKLKGKDTHTWTSISPTHMCVLLLLRRPKNYITHKSVWGDLSIIYRRQYKYIAGNLIDITTINGKPPLSFLVYEMPFISPLASILISGKHLQGFSC